MTEPTIDNQQKYENYREPFQRLNKALANGFNLEAMFIEYAIMEDRTESILRHADLWGAYGICSFRGKDRSDLRYGVSYPRRRGPARVFGISRRTRPPYGSGRRISFRIYPDRTYSGTSFEEENLPVDINGGGRGGLLRARNSVVRDPLRRRKELF